LALSGETANLESQYIRQPTVFKGSLAISIPSASPLPRAGDLQPQDPLPRAEARFPMPQLGGRGAAQFCAPPKPFIASVMPLGFSRICEKRTTVTVSSIETGRA
jgi:hypothetical protein